MPWPSLFKILWGSLFALSSGFVSSPLLPLVLRVTVKSSSDPCSTLNTGGVRVWKRTLKADSESRLRKRTPKGGVRNRGFGEHVERSSQGAGIRLWVDKHAGGPWGPPSLAYIQKGIVLNYHKLIKVTTKRFNEMRGELAGRWGWIQASASPAAWRGDGKAAALGGRSETRTLGVPWAPIRWQRISGS